MSKISDLILAVLYQLTGIIASLIGARGRKIFGSLLGFLILNLSSKRKNITLTNIRNAFPKGDDKFHLKILKESYQNFAITFIEMAALTFFSEKYLKKLIEFRNPELLNEIYSRKKGLILLSGHYANWEFAAYFSGILINGPVTVVVHTLKNMFVDRILNNARSKAGNIMIPMKHAARQLVKTILDGGVVGLLADQSAKFDKDLFVDFFGMPAATYTAPAFLALRFSCPMVFGFSERLPNGKYIIDIQEIDYSDLKNNEDGIRELTQRHVKLLEEQIRKNPGQWSWMHRRWKSPDSTNQIY